MPISLVSVIVPVRNGVPHLDVQLRALAAQDYKGAFEVIVSDNGSTDNLRDYLRDLTLDLNVRCVDSSDVRGASHARNVGIDSALGELLVFTDSDDAAHSNWLSALTTAAENFDALGGPIELDSLNTREVASWRRIPQPDQRFETVYLPYAQSCNFALWRRVAETVGYFDESLTMGGEDVDYSWRIQEMGMTLGHAPDAMMSYRLRRTVRASFEQGILYGRAAWPVLIKHRPQGCPSQPALLSVAANLASILYLATARNPLLPKLLRPPSRGRWAHILGMQIGSMQGRLHMVGTSMRRRVLPERPQRPVAD
ncbi:glycosyltransferase family 2 protein [Rhodococcus sp. NPDC057297]|uniref:glycosyltransferase family 2 protein n=1 Tax=Rhodococcus sp. NPDC057297 TaxID=3346090 RepID=UPI00363F9DE2